MNPPTLVLCQGFFGALFDVAARANLGAFRYFNRIDAALRSEGFRVLSPRVHPTGGVAKRARELKAFLLRCRSEWVDSPLVLVGHSMGGLDARYLVSKLGFDSEVSAVLTIATPHHGSAFADFCLTHLDRQAGLYGQLGRLGLDVAAARELTMATAIRFNIAVPDAPCVRYSCVTAAVPIQKQSPLLRPSGEVVDRTEGPNDGLVSVTSATWGAVVGHWPVDHLDQINKRPAALGGRDVSQRWVDAIRATIG